MFAALAMCLNPVKSEATPARSQRRPWSLVARLAVFYTLATTALLLVTMAVLYGVVVRYSDANDNLFLNDKLRAVRADLAVKKTNGGELLVEEVASEPSDYFVRVLDRRTGKVLAESPEMGKWLSPSVFPAAPPNGHIPEEGTEYKTSAGKWFLLMSAFAEIDRMMPRPVVLQIAQDRSDDKAFADFFRNLLLAVLVGGAGCSAAVALLVARRALRPLEQMVAAMKRVQASYLQPRLNRDRWPKELDSLAAAFDEMLARLKESFERLSAFSADLAHELRTPIQNLRGEAEVALTRTRTADEYREVIELSIEEYQGLANMIDNLLFLARAENAETPLNRLTFKIGPEIDTILDFYDAAARELNIGLSRQGDADLYADAMLVRRALSNLVSNALQHTSAGGQVLLTVKQGNGSVEIHARDTGSGIGPEHLPRIFNRFYRADAARNSNSGGVGLGLAIVKSIMDLHGGSVTAESKPGEGTIITLRFIQAEQMSRSDQHRTDLQPLV
ncbi:MAG: two-component system, OmpR family, heavy metal sensor histidine kinase CusS [Verrucomicrobiota bacterium]|jgi:two-component system, OmpR family, heavy metal sensor histidine kinase CusS